MRSVVILLVMVGAWAGVAVAQTTAPVALAARAPKPTVAVQQASCVTAECHANVKSAKVLHGPVNVNACDACHKLVSAKEHVFEDARPKSQSCTFCHKPEDHAAMPVVHKPFTEGECAQCHDPHGGPTGKFLRGENQNELCRKCHEDVMANKTHLHGPVAANACGSCHLPHAAPHKKLLVAQGRELCFTCHNEMQQQMKTVKVTHKAVEQDCSACHDPHGSTNPMQIKKAPAELCTSCHEHEKIKVMATGSKHKHSVVTEGKSCLNCHTAHGGDLAKLMKAEPTKVCMSCHGKEVVAAAEAAAPTTAPLAVAKSQPRKVPAVAGVMDAATHKHGSIKDGQCAGCHNVHGSDTSRLLAKPYPEAFYTSFALEKYDLCFTCHDKQLVQMAEAPGLTGFRNGTKNLHYLHVNKSEKGRTCRACHATHAAVDPHLIRPAVPFGNWQMPLNYKATATGGSCAPGCHKDYAYDRVNPVAAPVPPTPGPSTTPPPVAPTTAPANIAVSAVSGKS